MNLIIDLYPDQIVNDILNGKFLEQVAKIDDINIILTSMTNETSGDIKYLLKEDEIASNQNYLTEKVAKFQNSKINFIGEMFKGEMLRNPDYFIFSIMVIYTVKKPDELSSALEHIRTLQKEESSQDQKFPVAPPHLNPDTGNRFRKGQQKHSADEVLEYLSWLADANKLYDVALATFDLELAVMVAEYTQKDPKEYLPYIEKLRKITDPIELKLKICLDMKNYEEAITQLSAGDFTSIQKSIDLMIEHSLYKHSMIVYEKNLEVSRTIKNHFGDYLRKISNVKQAAIVYQSCGQFEKAMKAYEDTLDWKSGRKLLQFMGTAEPGVNDFLLKMKNLYLKGNSGQGEAAKILKCINGFERHEYIDLLVKATDWRTLKKIPISADADWAVVDDVILPAVRLAAELKINEIFQVCVEFKKWTARLVAVQEKKKNSLYLIAEDGEMTNYDTQSEFSMTSRGTSKFSVVTGASGVKGIKKPKKPKNLLHRKVKEGTFKIF